MHSEQTYFQFLTHRVLQIQMLHRLEFVRDPPSIKVPPQVDREEYGEEVEVAVADGGVEGGVTILLEKLLFIACNKKHNFLETHKFYVSYQFCMSNVDNEMSLE